MTCPSSLQIAQWEAGRIETAEAHRQTADHLRRCGRCRAFAADLGAVRNELLPDPLDSMNAARSIAALADERRQQRHRRWLRLLSLTAAPALAGAAALVLVIPRFTHDGTAAAPTPATAAEQRVLTKGGLAMEVYCKRQNAIFPVDDGAAFFAGDRLRFAYTAPLAGYLMIFGVDDDGQIFPYYSEQSLTSIPVAAGARAILPGSVELDGHRGLERIFALWSEKPIRGEPVRKAVADALASAGDIQLVVRLRVPGEQVSYLLKRP